MSWREYHEATKHSAGSLRHAPPYLDWANMPDPFRHYEAVPLLDLPADPPPPAIQALAVLQGEFGDVAPDSNGAQFLSQLLFHSAAISAAKRVPSTGGKYALRVNPSSGNLHPTEFHFVTRGLNGWPDGLYHYRASSHMAEQRALGDFTSQLGFDAPLVFLLTSIAWREAWKYGARAYRYCLHDLGHAWQALALAARALGCESIATGQFRDDEVSRICRLNEDEWPMLAVSLFGPSIPTRSPDAGGMVWYGGAANRLSSETIGYPPIDRIHNDTKVVCQAGAAPSVERERLPAVVSSNRGFGEVVRKRRSALDFQGGARSISMAELSTILNAADEPLFADFAIARLVQLYLYVHRVDALAPGVYRYGAGRGDLQLVLEGDQRVAAAGLSLGQDLAGNACVAFSMIADLEGAANTFGNRGYRYAHFEAGAIGHRMYLAAEALGSRATGIGAFYDDRVHRYLRFEPGQGQVIYHFAIGHAVDDPRLDA